MIPTIHPFGDIYLRYCWSPVEVGDVIVLLDNKGMLACKRVIGMEGMYVKRYGAFVELFKNRKDLGIRHASQNDQLDGNGKNSKPHHCKESQSKDTSNHLSNEFEIDKDDNCHEQHLHDAHMASSFQYKAWDTNAILRSKHSNHNDVKHTLICIPKGHLWVEGDNPLYSIDSRHYGPIPVSKIKGKCIFKLWPLYRHSTIYTSTDSSNESLLDSKLNTLSRFVQPVRPPPPTEEEMFGGNFNIFKVEQKHMRSSS